jgi:hypothetical protein
MGGFCYRLLQVFACARWLRVGADVLCCDARHGSCRQFTVSGITSFCSPTHWLCPIRRPVFPQTKQIKSVLRQDPERSLYHASHPGPLLEVDFWIAKSRNLNSIFTQLQVAFSRTITAHVLARQRSSRVNDAAMCCAATRVHPRHVLAWMCRTSAFVPRCAHWMTRQARTRRRSRSCAKMSSRRVSKRTTTCGTCNR